MTQLPVLDLNEPDAVVSLADLARSRFDYDFENYA